MWCGVVVLLLIREIDFEGAGGVCMSPARCVHVACKMSAAREASL